jgi:hypothetical protein
MTAAMPAGVIAAAVAAARAHLRLEDGAEAGVLSAHAASALALAEAFCGTVLVPRDGGSWDALPPPVAQGVVLLIAHLFADRDGTAAPPAAVAALWRPWRRMRLLRETIA